MFYTAIILVSLLMVLMAISAFILVVHSIRREDRRRSLTHNPRGPLAYGTRRMLGFSVDHSGCEARPDHACPACLELTV
ncbi:hypothetical protein [Acrocarpospora catenulata]|uniref:hypothetical protein n=1 Tax=Acrocarpospora catenulata TaxID=2836182 RepID=UPI001BDA2D5D|nr:hypothetical protein [Acrocarpospora catenulata]